MIDSGFEFIAAIFGLCGITVWLEQRYASRLFQWFPSIVLVMFASMAMYTFGAWELTLEIRSARSSVRDNLIPAMLFLMSLRFNLTVVRKLGVRLILLCLASTASIMVGFVAVHQAMRGFLGNESAGWTGGTQNFVAVKEALGVTDDAMTYTLLMGALCYSVWLVVIIALKPFRPRFDGVLRADDRGLDEVMRDLDKSGSAGSPDTASLLIMLGFSLVVAAISQRTGGALAQFGVFNPMIWAIILSSLLGILAAPSALGRAAGSDEVSGIMLYAIVALIGAEVSLGALREAPLYILSGFLILALHAVILLAVGRLLKMNLHLVGIASIANIGSAPSAAVVGAAYDKRLVPVAVMMALIGSMLGSFVGLTMAEILGYLNR